MHSDITHASAVLAAARRRQWCAHLKVLGAGEILLGNDATAHSRRQWVGYLDRKAVMSPSVYWKTVYTKGFKVSGKGVRGKVCKYQKFKCNLQISPKSHHQAGLGMIRR